MQETQEVQVWSLGQEDPLKEETQNAAEMVRKQKLTHKYSVEIP